MSDGHWCQLCSGELTFEECCAADMKRIKGRNAEPEKLRAEVERLRAFIEARAEEADVFNRKFSKLEAENAELRGQALARDFDAAAEANQLTRRLETFKARLAWFEEAWSWVKAAMLRVQELEDVKAFRHDEVLLKLVAPIISKIEEHDRPKPSEGT